MRSFFANGVDKMHIPWAVEGLPMLLHLSLFLFFGGLGVFLFNVDHEVFTYVVWWIVLFLMVYGLITLLPLIRLDSPYSTPLSTQAWFLYASIQYATFTVLEFIVDSRGGGYRWMHLKYRYRDWMLGGVEKIAGKAASNQSSEIDIRIFRWTMSALGNDHSLEKFFEAIPGLFNSDLVNYLERDFPLSLLRTFWEALNMFVGRTLFSNSVTPSVKSRRIFIYRDIISMIPCIDTITPGMYFDIWSHIDQAPVSMERLQAMARWFTHTSLHVSCTAQRRVIENLPKIKPRGHPWIELARKLYGISGADLLLNVDYGRDSSLVATLIHVSRQVVHSENMNRSLLSVEELTDFDIRHTLPGLQHDFCTVWNELVEEAKKQGCLSNPVKILYLIRDLYITLHQGTDAAPTAFSASTPNHDDVLFQPSSYPLCNIASHRPDSTTHVPVPDPRSVPLTQPADSPDASLLHSTSGGLLHSLHSISGGSTVSRQVEQTNITASPPFPTTPSETGDSSQAPLATEPVLPVHTNPHFTDASPSGTVFVVLQDVLSADALTRPLEGTTQGDIVALCAEQDITSEFLSTTSASAPAPILPPVPASTGTPPVLSKSLASRDTGATCAPNPLLPASSVVGFSTPVSLPPSRVPPLSNAELLTLLSGTTPSLPTNNAPLRRMRARALVNNGNTCFANAVLQLLVYSPQFWNLFRELGDLKGLRGAGGLETGGGATPLVDVTVRFFEEFMFKGKELPPTQQLPRQTTGGKPSEDEEAEYEHKAVDSFEPIYMYDAMKEKRQLKKLLVGARATNPPAVTD